MNIIVWTGTSKIMLPHCLLPYSLPSPPPFSFPSLWPFPLTFSFMCFGDAGDFHLLKGVCCFGKSCTRVIP